MIKKEDYEPGGFEAIVALCVSVGLGPIMRGLCLKYLWAWFVVSTFGLPTLNIPQALGIGLTLATFAGVEHSSYKGETRGQWWGAILGRVLFAPLVTLLFGLIYRAFL